MTYKIHISLIIFFVFILSAEGQERTKDTIDTDVVNVVKPYTPTISDAFKIKETPKLNDSTVLKKKDIKYNIFSIPVASTFTPAKGKAATVNKEKPPVLYDNYASLGVGTYTTILGEVYLNHALNRNETVGGYFSHHSSGGGIDGVVLDDDFLKSKLNANYSSKLRDLAWKVNGGFEYQQFNWYGLPEEFVTITSEEEFQDVGHSFYSAHVGGSVDFYDMIFNSGSVLYRRFGDNQGSGENRFVLKTDLEVPISGEAISAEVKLDYIGGGFDQNYYTDDAIDYGNFNVSLAPSYQMIEDDLTLNLGVNLTYLNDTQEGGNKFFIYPNITASYRLLDEFVIAFGGIEGGLIQNSYYDFANTNPFVSPTLTVSPTDQTYNASLGIKGKLSDNLSYNISGRYLTDNNKALFQANSHLGDADEPYEHGNSFRIVYDDVNTFSVGGELNIDVNRNFKLGIKAEYFTYSTDLEEEAWNLPDTKASLFLDYQISRKWFAGANLFYIGERKDLLYQEAILVAPLQPMTVTLDSYFDANAHLGYKINDRLSVYGKANNIGNQLYEKWLNYPVQGIQILAGATYQFDF